MAGLPTRSDNALQQWHHLFESRGEQRSLQAQQHWQQLMRVGLPTRKHEKLEIHRAGQPAGTAVRAGGRARRER